MSMEEHSCCHSKPKPEPETKASCCSGHAVAAASSHDGHQHHGHHHGHAAHHDHAAQVAKDPVCGMTVDPSTAKHHAEHGGVTFHFCAQRCKDKFLADPARYLKPDDAPPPPALAGAVYTCPMHPEVQQIGPGHCPKCGMALEPMMPSLDEDDGHELLAMSRRFWSLVALTLPVHPACSKCP